MTKATTLILGSLLFLQVPAYMISQNRGGSVDMASETSQAQALPISYEDHSKELMNGPGTSEVVEAAPATPAAMARYIHKQTRELLPVPFRGRSRQIAQALIETANKHQMDPLFLMAVIKQESRFNPKARGAHGEIGLMQLKPTTALTLSKSATLEEVSQDLLDPVKNIQLGAAYLAKLRVSFKRNGNLYISAYNMGAARVRNHVASGVKPRIYSDQVLARYNKFASDVKVAGLDIEVLHRTLDL